MFVIDFQLIFVYSQMTKIQGKFVKRKKLVLEEMLSFQEFKKSKAM